MFDDDDDDSVVQFEGRLGPSFWSGDGIDRDRLMTEPFG
jgi:hypothetical protein